MNRYIAIAMLVAFIFGIVMLAMYQIGEMPEYEYVPDEITERMVQIEKGV